MKAIVKNILIFLTGLGVGGGVTYLIMEDKAIQSAKNVVDSEEPDERLGREETKASPVKPLGREFSASYDPEKNGRIIPPSKIKKRYTDYNKKIDDEGYGSEAVDSGRELTDNGMPPFVIPLESFTNEYREHDKTSIRWYSVDCTLADENDDIIDDLESTIGPDALENFGRESKDPDIVYIRNYQLGTDFEVVRVHKSYKELVLGIVEEKPRRKKEKNEAKREPGS